jgi:hypothetical protein
MRGLRGAASGLLVALALSGSPTAVHANAFGEAIRRDARAVGASFKEGAHRVAVAAKSAAHEVATAARRGATETRAALHGEKKRATPAG